jgi:hypothetical protein
MAPPIPDVHRLFCQPVSPQLFAYSLSIFSYLLGVEVDTVCAFGAPRYLVTETSIVALLLVLVRGKQNEALGWLLDDPLFGEILHAVPLNETLHLPEGFPCRCAYTCVCGKPDDLRWLLLLLPGLLSTTTTGPGSLNKFELYRGSSNGIPPFLNVGKIAEPVEKVSLEFLLGMLAGRHRSRLRIAVVDEFDVLRTALSRPLVRGHRWCRHGAESCGGAAPGLGNWQPPTRSIRTSEV